MKFFFLLFFLVLIIFATQSLAIGVAPPYYRYQYQPGFEGNFSHMISTMGKPLYATVNISGNLAPYVTYYDKEVISDKSKAFLHYSIKLPENTEIVGKNYVMFSVVEAAKKGGRGASSRVGVNALFIVNFPYPGIYPEMSLGTDNINEGEEIYLLTTLKNLGKDRIVDSTLLLWIEDNDKNKIFEERFEGLNFSFENSTEVEKYIPSNNLPPGVYTAYAKLDCGEVIEKERIFNIGTYDIEIANYTKEITNDGINRFEVILKSKWKGELKNVYAELFFNKKTYKSATQSFLNFQVNNMELFIESDDLSPGVHKGTLTIYFDGKDKNEEIKITVIEKNKNEPEKEIQEEEPQIPEEEQHGIFNITTGLIVFVVLLLLFNIIILRKKIVKNR